MAVDRDSLEPDKGNGGESAEAKPHKPKTTKEKEEEKARYLAEVEEERKRKKQEDDRQKEIEDRRKKRKLITPITMLSIGLISAVTMFLMKFENQRMLIWLLIILVVSGIIGRLIRFMFDKFARQNDETVSDEGEVINKGSGTSEEVK